MVFVRYVTNRILHRRDDWQYLPRRQPAMGQALLVDRKQWFGQSSTSTTATILVAHDDR